MNRRIKNLWFRVYKNIKLYSQTTINRHNFTAVELGNGVGHIAQTIVGHIEQPNMEAETRYFRIARRSGQTYMEAETRYFRQAGGKCAIKAITHGTLIRSTLEHLPGCRVSTNAIYDLRSYCARRASYFPIP